MVYSQCGATAEVSGQFRKLNPFPLTYFIFRDNFSNDRMAIICLTCTLASILPSLVHLFRNANPKTFLLSLINSALAFFLFSFQVSCWKTKFF